MEETLIEEEIDVAIEEEPERVYTGKKVCPICGRTDCGWS
jgi:hypothetical protein